MSGAVLAIRIIPPSGTSGARFVPGSSSTNMSLRPVRGRSIAVASSCTRSSYWESSSTVTIARPSFSSAPAMSPTRTPATLTVCPWPGRTAWASLSSNLIVNVSSSISGKWMRWLARM